MQCDAKRWSDAHIHRETGNAVVEPAPAGNALNIKLSNGLTFTTRSCPKLGCSESDTTSMGFGEARLVDFVQLELPLLWQW